MSLSEDLDDQKKVRFQWKLTIKVAQLLILLLLLINCREQSECPRIREIKCDAGTLNKSTPCICHPQIELLTTVK